MCTQLYTRTLAHTLIPTRHTRVAANPLCLSVVIVYMLWLRPMVHGSAENPFAHRISLKRSVDRTYQSVFLTIVSTRVRKRFAHCQRPFITTCAHSYFWYVTREEAANTHSDTLAATRFPGSSLISNLSFIGLWRAPSQWTLLMMWCVLHGCRPAMLFYLFDMMTSCMWINKT